MTEGGPADPYIYTLVGMALWCVWYALLILYNHRRLSTIENAQFIVAMLGLAGLALTALAIGSEAIP